jgi:hypothetical protein
MERFARLTYSMQLIVALAVYGALLAISIALLAEGRFDDSPLRFVIALIPVFGMALVVLVVVIRFRSLDEYWQTVHLTALPFALLGSMGIAITWGFLKNVGAPELSGFAWFLVMNAAYLVGLGVARWRYS